MRFLFMVAISIAIYVLTNSILYAVLMLIALMLAPFILAAVIGFVLLVGGAIAMLIAFLFGCGVSGMRAVANSRKK